MLATIALGCAACSSSDSDEVVDQTSTSMPMTLTSPDFDPGAELPTSLTCEGDDESPALTFSNVPDDAAELRLVVEDPDAPDGTFVHWSVTDIPPAVDGAPEGAAPAGGVEGLNDFGDTGYGGPCPPEDDDAHTYVFRLEARDERGTVIATAEITGTYDR